MNKTNKTNKTLIALAILAFTTGALAATLGDLATNIQKTFEQIGQLMMGISYVAGIGFFIGAIFKFKQHKDNPTQIPMGTPIALLMIAISLLFMPYIIEASGGTFTGDESQNYIGSPTGDKLPGVDS